MKNKHWFARCLIVSATSLALAAPFAAGAATEWFLNIDGIKGESTSASHKGAIEVLAWSWGMSRGALDSLSRGKGSPACVTDMAFSKYLDAATPALMANVLSGMTIPGATLAVRKAGEDKGGQDFLVIVMKDVIITSVADSGSPSDIPVESISLKFASAKVSYKQQKADGSSGTAIETTIKGGGC